MLPSKIFSYQMIYIYIYLNGEIGKIVDLCM